MTADQPSPCGNRVRPRRRDWKLAGFLTIGMVALPAVVALVVGALLAAIPQVTIVVVNRDSVELRLGFCVDDAVDVPAGGRESLGVTAGVSSSCGVYEFGTYRGCLTLGPDLKDGAVKVLREDVNPNVSEDKCVGG